MTALTAEQAHIIWDVLSYHAGASDEGRDAFVDVQVNSAPDEYRFGGMLGFGGKFWNYRDRWYVTAYPEDHQRDPDLGRKLDATNAALAEVQRQSSEVAR